MLKKRFRLRGKDVNFLLKKRQYFATKYFGFFYFDQYSNLKFNQISINIPLKYSKSSIKRTSIKRLILKWIKDNGWDKKNINDRFLKVFISLNKKSIGELKSQIEKFDKVNRNNYILSNFQESFLYFMYKVGKK